MNTRYIVLCFLFALPLPLLAEPTLRVATYNIRGDFSEGQVTDKPNAWQSSVGPNRRELLLETATALDADVLAVQEAYANQVLELAAALTAHDHYGVGRDDGKSAGEHCAIYWRKTQFRSTDHGTFWLSEKPKQPGSMCLDAACTRIASWVVLEPTEEFAAKGWTQPLLFLNTHWDHVSQQARLFSAELIREQVSLVAPGQTNRLARVLVGDFNAAEDSSEIEMLRTGRKVTGGNALPAFTDAYRALHERSDQERTHHGFQGKTVGKRIDHVFVDATLLPVSAKIDRTQKDGRYPSDHYPVLVELASAEQSKK